MASILALDQRFAAVHWSREPYCTSFANVVPRPSGALAVRLAMRSVTSLCILNVLQYHLHKDFSKYDVANPAKETQGGEGAGLCTRPCPHQPRQRNVAKKMDLLHTSSSMLRVYSHLAFHIGFDRTAAAAPARPSRAVSRPAPSHRHTSPPPLAEPLDTVCVPGAGIDGGEVKASS